MFFQLFSLDLDDNTKLNNILSSQSPYCYIHLNIPLAPVYLGNQQYPYTE